MTEKSRLKELWNSYFPSWLKTNIFLQATAIRVFLTLEKTYHFLMLLTKQRHWHPRCFHRSPDIWCHSITPKQAIKKGLQMWVITAANQMEQYLRKHWPHKQRYFFHKNKILHSRPKPSYVNWGKKKSNTFFKVLPPWSC